MSRTLLTGNAAAAWGARLAGAEYIPAFPITPQTEIIETLGRWIDAGEMRSRMVTLESEHSMITAAGAASVTGVRVFSATSSQGLLYGMEMLYTVAGWRAPFVLVNVSRALAAPITLGPDHNDIMAARDCGALQIHCATCQEILDSVLIAYRLSEAAPVRLPVIVNFDGFFLSFTREPVEIPDAEATAKYVGTFDPSTLRFRASQPVSQAVAVMSGSLYSYFRYECELAAQAALGFYDETAAAFAESFGRDYPAVETYRIDDAETAFVMMGSFATKGLAAVDRLRAAGHKVGLVRPRLFRPFPAEQLRQALRGKRAAAVVDQNLSIGSGGVLHTELAAALCGHRNMPLLASFVGGLGGRDIGDDEFTAMIESVDHAADPDAPPEPRLMFTENELREVRKLQAIASVERHELEKMP
jgi:pyruvate ferredoxin oxidoreductase alpha subunit